MDVDLKESIDFNFFDECPERQSEEVTPSPLNASALKPPVHPSSAKPLPNTGIVGNISDSKFSDHARRSGSSSESDISRDSSPENLSVSNSKSENNNKSLSSHKKAGVKSQSSCSSLSSTSSARSSFSSSSSLPEKSSNYYDSHFQSKESDTENRSHSTSASDNEGRPTNPLAKPQKQIFYKRNRQEKAENSFNKHPDSDNRKAKNSTILCDDTGDSNWASKNINRRHGWEEVNDTKEQEKRSKFVKASGTFSKDRPKTAVKKKTKIVCRDQVPRSCSSSGTFSDSDITDVSSIDTPRNGAQEKYQGKSEHSQITSAGDGHPVKIRFKSVSDVGQKDNGTDYDPDKITGLDLNILMKAVGELEKQKRVKANSRRVMFDPTTQRSIEKANYTFDKKQTRDIERENHRLLKEIVRQVNSEEQRKQFYRPSDFYRLTPSAVNRERDIQRIERENLAFLKRLQEVKPTKSMCRDQQLKAYENTVYHGVPIAALHHKPKGSHLHNFAIDDSDISIEGRTRSVTSITSIGSSVRSVGSSRSSRPSSASRKGVSSTKPFDSRPAWSDRW